MTSAGIGSPQHVAGELFKMMAGVDLQHVPYRGVASALTDLMGGWPGIGAPRNTPADIVDTLNREINAGLASPTLRDRFAEFGVTVMPLSRADFAALIADDVAKWSKVIKFAGLRAD